MNNVLIKADYSGQELRVLAEVSKDEYMLNCFKRNWDLHLNTARYIFSLPLEDTVLETGTPANREAVRKYARERHQAKNGVNFPIIYGASAQRISEDNGVSIYEAQRWLDGFFELYPGVKKAIEKTKQELWDKGYVVNLMGRKRRFPGYRTATKSEKKHMLRQAFNFKIQGFSADMIKIAANKIRKILAKYLAKIVLTVHDELVYECPESRSKAFAARIKEIMENCVALSIPIKADVSIVRTYGD